MKTKFLLAIALILTLASCKTTIATNYRLTDANKRHYFTDTIKYIGKNKDSIQFSELKRNGDIRGSFTLALKDTQIKEK